MNVAATVVERALRQIATAAPDPNIQAFIQTNVTLSEQELLKADISQALVAAIGQLPKEWKGMQGKYSAAQIIQADVDAVSGVLKAIGLGCSGSPGEFVRAALVSSAMEFSCPELFKILEPHCSCSPKTAAWSFRIVQGFQLSVDLRPGVPVHEKEAFERHKKAVHDQNFSRVTELLGMLKRGVGLPRHAILEKITCLAAKADIPATGKWLDELVRTDFLAAHVALRSLSADALAKVTIAAESQVIKMDALTLLLDGAPYYKANFNPSAVTSAIQTLLADPTAWQTFCSFFGEYPTRTPALWHATGLALHGASSSNVQTLVDSFNSGRYNPHPDEYFQVLIGLTAEPPPQKTLNTFLLATEAKWRSHFRKRRHSLEDAVTDIEVTNYYGAMLNAIIMRWDLPKLKRHIRWHLRFIGLIHSRWFESETTMASYVALSASQLLPYIEAYSHMAASAQDAAFESEAANAINYYFGYYYSNLWRGAEKYAAETVKML